MVLIVLALLTLTQSGGAPVPAPRPAPSSWMATELDMLSDERQSLAGITRIAVTVTAPDDLGSSLRRDTLASTIAFKLEQAGLVVVPTREVEDPLLAVSIHTTSSGTAADPGWMAYRVSVDTMQLVRLRDDGARARFALASTWQVASHGVVAASNTAEIRTRALALVDEFLADRRGTQPRPALSLTPGLR